ncbi:MAG: hypothetical protein WCO26_01455 [Deltaproteobacteria bacterium]
MGPITLFDKSFLQSLSLDEAVFFDHFFYTNTCPIFYVETLADLDKVVRSGRTPEEEVRILADKTPQMSGNVNVFHRDTCIGDLLGNTPPMEGQILIPGGRPVRHGNQSGIVFEEAPEERAFRRWRDHKFTEVEHDFARVWRGMLGSVDNGILARALRELGLRPGRCKTLEDAKDIAERLIQDSNNPESRIRLTLWLLGIPGQFRKEILLRWTLEEKPTLVRFAPYASFVLSVKVFFQIARAAELISQKPSAIMDISYLFYLPFCMVFTSSDKLHKRCAPLFLRSDQEFIAGKDLRLDLSRIVEHFNAFPEGEKEKGLYAIATRPPDEAPLTSRLWDRFLPNWPKSETGPVERDRVKNEYLVNYIKSFAEAPRLRPEEVDFDLHNPDSAIVERRVSKRRGNWWQLPKDLREKD